MAGLVAGVDVGGTFTDLVVCDPASGSVRLAKVPTSLPNQAPGVLAAFEAAGVDLEGVDLVVHGTTTTTNAVLERRLARTGLITTAGFRDVLELGRRTRPQPYGMTGRFVPVIPRDLRLEVPEPMDARGRVLTPLDEGAHGGGRRGLAAGQAFQGGAGLAQDLGAVPRGTGDLHLGGGAEPGDPRVVGAGRGLCQLGAPREGGILAVPPGGLGGLVGAALGAPVAGHLRLDIHRVALAEHGDRGGALRGGEAVGPRGIQHDAPQVVLEVGPAVAGRAGAQAEAEQRKEGWVRTHRARLRGGGLGVRPEAGDSVPRAISLVRRRGLAMRSEQTTAIILATLLSQVGCGPGAECTVDLDGDGYLSAASCVAGDDCDDLDPDVNPGQQEVCDGEDNNCDGFVDDVLLDADSDGYYDRACQMGTDCDDDDPSVHPDAEELCNGRDDDCNGAVDDRDLDGDGAVAQACSGGDDCDDGDASVHPDAVEDCSNGVDDDCDGSVDDEDADGDGQRSADCGGQDCDDADPSVFRGAVERCDEVDRDCDGEVHDVDADGDGWYDPACGGDDCDEGDPEINPGAVDWCTDGVDNDCDGVTDLEDADGDGDQPIVCGGSDCDDRDPAVAGILDELCGDALDNDCDGAVDNADLDQDGHIDEACGGDDCDDDEVNVHPGMVEHCDDLDADCDGDLADVDRDGDGSFDGACGGRDCNDGLTLVTPVGPELCDGLDNDCDGTSDGCSQGLPGGLDFEVDLSDQFWVDGGWSFADGALIYSGTADDAYHYAVYTETYFQAPYDIGLDITREAGDEGDGIGIIIGQGYSSDDGVFVHIKEQQGSMVYNIGYRAGGTVNSQSGHTAWPGIVRELGLPNRLRLEHDGEQLHLSINGGWVGTWRQTTYTEGALVLYVNDTAADGPVDVLFDNVQAEGD